MVEKISLRPEQPGDEPFLFAVYAAARQEELDLTGWNTVARAAFLDMQFRAMCRGYHAMFPTADFSIVLSGQEKTGRMVIHRTDKEIRVVDLALLPEFRSRKIGAHLMRRVCDEAARAKKAVTLSVFKNTRPVRWYQRLGFSIVGETGLYHEMAWRPEGLNPP
jgi:ribosomal protein S18 acetylase RimI-like enzyme